MEFGFILDFFFLGVVEGFAAEACDLALRPSQRAYDIRDMLLSNVAKLNSQSR